MASRDFELRMDEDRTLRGTLELPSSARGAAPVVLFCHGFKGFKDWGGWPWLCRELAARGFLVCRFNFSLSGVGAAQDRHDEPEKFAINTYGEELTDLRFLIDHLRECGVPESSCDAPLGLLGHSRGGLVAVLYAAEDERVAAVATLGAPGHSDRFSDEVITEWRHRGYHEVLNARTGEVLRLSTAVIDDYERNRDRYDVSKAVARRAVPTLVIHGEDDESVPADEARELYDSIPHGQRRLQILPRTGHTFGTIHPFAAPTPELRRILDDVAAWFAMNLER